MADKENKQATKQATKQETQAQPEKKLYNFYGAREAKSGRGISVSLVTGKDETKEWVNAYVKYDADGPVKVKVQDGFAYIKVPILKPAKPKDTLDF